LEFDNWLVNTRQLSIILEIFTFIYLCPLTYQNISRSNLAESKKYYTVEEYLTFEREALEKHEYIDGEIIAMAGATRKHNLIGTNTTFVLMSQLRGGSCEVYVNDMRVRMKRNRYGYLDVIVVFCLLRRACATKPINSKPIKKWKASKNVC
jgi:hypothetical protein